jgi:hypothetical protein
MQPDAARALADQTAEIVRRHVEAATAPLLLRIAALEARPSPEKGDKGDQGDKGDTGIGVKSLIIDREGSLRAVLADGTQHNLGKVVGKDGEDGRDAEPAEPAEPGVGIADVLRNEADEVIVKLTSGREINLGSFKGADGITPQPGFEIDEAGDTATLSFQIGEASESFEFALPYAGQACGLFDEDAVYRRMDVVSFNGSEWRAKHDNPGPLPGDGWMLSASRGKRGDRGERGEKGLEGKPGNDGANMTAIALAGDEMILRVALDNGEVLEADFAPIANAVAAAVKGE